MTKGRGRLPGSRCKPYVPRSLGSVYALTSYTRHSPPITSGGECKVRSERGY